MFRDLWAEAIGAILSAALFAWLWRGTRRGHGSLSEGVLAYAWPWRIFSFAALAFSGFVGMMCLWEVHAKGPRRGDGFVFGGMATLIALGLAFTVETWRARILFDERGIHRQSPWWPRAFLPWETLRHIRWSPTWRAWILKDASGRRVILSGLMSGHQAFAQGVLAHAPAIKSSDEEDQVRMRRSAAGDLSWLNPLS